MPAAPEFIPLPKAKEMHAMMNWRDSPGMHGGSDNATPTPAPIPNAVIAPNGNGMEKDVKGRGRARASRKRAGKEQHPQAPDVEDFFIHIDLPPGVAFQTLQFELQTQTTPLKAIDIGMPKVFLPRSPPQPQQQGGTPLPAGSTPSQEEAADGRNALLQAFKTPAMHATTLSSTDDEAFPPAMALLPPSNKAETAASNTSNGSASDAAAAAAPKGDYRVSLLYAEKTEAEKVMAFLQKRWPSATIVLAPRSRSVLNASLVLKGLPTLNKTELIIEELEKLSHKPSYVRLHRSDRGGFKNVVFIKYSNREDAEEIKLRLERFTIGNRSLKVEFKKKTAKPEESQASATAPAATTNGTVTNGVGSETLQQIVRDLRVSTEHEGFIYQRKDLSKEDLKMLKQLCQSYNLTFEMTDVKVTVKRQLGVTSRAGWTSSSPSPAMRPQATPNWVPATPTPLRPMDFKGISHWKDIRSQVNARGVLRPIGPEDGMPPFPVGRGRPL